jgi:hypothetical protein
MSAYCDKCSQYTDYIQGVVTANGPYDWCSDCIKERLEELEADSAVVKADKARMVEGLVDGISEDNRETLFEICVKEYVPNNILKEWYDLYKDDNDHRCCYN